MLKGKDLYEVLGVPRTATDDEIRKAFRKLARKLHPDVNAGKKDLEEKFKEVNAAYEVLGNPDKRKLYDEFGEESLQTGFDPERARAWRNRAHTSTTNIPFTGGEGLGNFAFDPSDLFGDMFGVGPRPRRQDKMSKRLVVEIDLAQAIHGAQVQVEIQAPQPCSACGGQGGQRGAPPMKCADCDGTGRTSAGGDRIRMMTTCQSCGGAGWMQPPCPACNGMGAVKITRPVTVRIPPGADNGSRLRVPAEKTGLPADVGTDLVIETRVRPHPHFRREGLDLHLALPVTVDEAYNGGSVTVPTPHGNVDMKVPARSQTGSVLRLRGKGVHRGSAKGDLYVELHVKLPDGDDGKFAEAARAAAHAYSRPVRSGIAL